MGERLLRAWWWLCDRPLAIRLWLYDQVAGPLPETEADRIRRRSTMPIVPLRQRWWFFLAAVLLLAAPAHAQRAGAILSDADVRQEIIRDSIRAYKATGHPCACPFDLMRNGRECGSRSSYSRPGGASPICYPKDVTDAQVREWRSRHPSH